MILCLIVAAGMGCALAAVLRGDSAVPNPDKQDFSVLHGSDAEALIHDAGEVIAGEVVTHGVVLRNDWDEAIDIRNPSDIVIHCGCSSIDPVVRRLEPGESSEIKVTLRTLGREGTFANGGEIIWTATSGKQRRFVLTLRVEVRPALRASPAVLIFDDEAEADAMNKEITFAATKDPIDWASLRVTVASPFQVVKVEKNKDQMRCIITHPKESEREEVTGRVQASAQLCGATTKDRDLVTATVGVIWRPRQGELRIVPKVVPLAVDGQGRGTARLYLRGKMVETNPRLIRSISCEGYVAEWKMLPAAKGKAAILDLRLDPRSGAKTPETQLLQVDFVDAKSVRRPAFRFAPRRRSVECRIRQLLCECPAGTKGMRSPLSMLLPPPNGAKNRACGSEE